MRIIPIKITEEYVEGAGVVVGSEYSHDDVALEITFGSMWDGLTKHITFVDANNENPTLVYLTSSLLKPNTTNTYIVPIPAEAKYVAGDCAMSVKGCTVDAHTISATINQATWEAEQSIVKVDGTYEFEYATGVWYYGSTGKTLSTLGITVTGTPINGDKLVVTRTTVSSVVTDTIAVEINHPELIASLSAKCTFRVLESVYDEDAEESVVITSSVADQIAASVNTATGTANWTKNAVENATGSVTMVSPSTPASVDVSIVNNHMDFDFNIPFSGGGGGGKGVYNIVFTMDDNEVITCDKTFDEVLAAKQSGMVVVGKMNIPNMWSSEYSVDGHLPLTAYVEDTNHNKWLEFSGASSNSIYDANTITSTAIRWYQSSSRSSEHIYFNVAYADREILGTVDSFVDLRYETTSTDDDASDDGELLTQAIYGKQVLVYFANDWFTVKVPLTFTNVTTLSDAYNTKIYSGESLYRIPYPNGEWTKYKSMRLTLTLTTTQYGGGQINYALTTKTEEIKSTNFYTVQVPNTGWSQDTTAGWYTKSITVTGMLSTDNPVVDIDLSSAATASAITSLLTDWAKILRISTSANTITLYASSAISQAITLKLQVTR